MTAAGQTGTLRWPFRRYLTRYTQPAYDKWMHGVFVELPAFERFREVYLNDEAFRRLQDLLMADPLAGDVVEGTVRTRLRT
jgi:hypothetical protein